MSIGQAMGTSKKTTRKAKAASAGKKNKSHKMPPICEYTMGSDEEVITMSLECKGCPGPHMPEGKCLGPLLAAFLKEYNVRKINVSHYIEKQYYGTAITIISKITNLSNEVENLSLRNPVKEYFGRKGVKEGRRVPCLKCAVHPGRLFRKMRLLAIKDIQRFYNTLKSTANKIPQQKRKTKFCERCLHATTEDLNYIFDEYEKIAGFIANHAYNVMLQGNRSPYSFWSAPQVMEQYLSPLMGYQQGMAGMHNTGMNGRMCTVCMCPLGGNEKSCPKCGTKLSW